MNSKNLPWILLVFLSIVWGSSFILMKKALISFSPIQLGALRILISALFLLLIGFHRLLKIKRRHWVFLLLCALTGTFFPSFFFAYAIEKMDSSVASILNSLTPLNTLIVGALIFGFGFNKRQLIGVLVGLLGTIFLIIKGAEINPHHNYFYSIFILLSTIGYAFSVNILKKYLHDLDSISITVGMFFLLIIPTSFVLYYSGFFESVEIYETNIEGLIYISILAIFGTGIALVLFNHLIQISSPIFSSSVTYLIPIVAIIWGIFDGEKLEFLQILAGLVILLGVFLVNKNK